VRVWGIDRARDRPAALSRHGRKVFVEEAPDVFSAYREGLRRVAREEGDSPVVLPSNDEAVDVLHEEREGLGRSFRFVIAPGEAVERLTDKLAFFETAEGLGLAPPRTWLLSSLPEGLEEPLVLKPRRRYGGGGARLEPPRFVDGPRELEEARRELVGRDEDYVVQERVPGGDGRLEIYGAYWSRGSPVAEFTGTKIHQYPPGYGSTACAVLTEDGEVRELARRLLSRLRFHGCVDVEFKRDDGGCLRVIEVNPRTALWHRLGELAGVSLPLIAYRAETGAPLPPPSRRRVGRCWMYLERELRTLRGRPREEGGGWRGLVRLLPRVRRFALLSLEDPRPFLSSAARPLRARWRRLRAGRRGGDAGGRALR
jgi:predicted ATP-grasp superfamily ATP-dependent carboligase